MTNYLHILLILTIVLGLVRCIATQQARIESDYSCSGNFCRFRTYDFVRSIFDRYRILAEVYLLAPNAAVAGSQ